jgi:hypothetical protein
MFRLGTVRQPTLADLRCCPMCKARRLGPLSCVTVGKTAVGLDDPALSGNLPRRIDDAAGILSRLGQLAIWNAISVHGSAAESVSTGRTPKELPP